MIFSTVDPRLFVGFIPSLRYPVWMTRSTAAKAYGGSLPSLMTPVEIKWSDDEQVLRQELNGRWMLVGGWSLYLDLFSFALDRIYTKGTDKQRLGYAQKFASRIMFGEERRSPDQDMLRGMADARQGRTDRWADKAYYQAKGAALIERLIQQPTIIMR